MDISQKLVKAFLNDACTPEEKEFVAAWFRKHPEQLAKYLTEESWNIFESYPTEVPASEQMLQFINERINKKVVRFRQIKWMAAASVMLALSASVYYFVTDGSMHTGRVNGNMAVITNVPQPVYKKESNNSSSPEKIILQDGSIVTLATGSHIAYYIPFVGNRRDIYLNGEANFKVAKDALRPFCVHSGNINTTALGTVFTVNAKNSSRISVKLFEGKVVIRNEHKNSGIKDVYLMPGHELTFDDEKNIAAVHLIETETLKEKTIHLQKTIIAKPLTVLHFDNKPLDEIFTDLEEVYHIKIKYDAAAIKDINFTGTHKTASETLDDFLNTVATLNDLIIEKQGEDYIVTQAK